MEATTTLPVQFPDPVLYQKKTKPHTTSALQLKHQKSECLGINYTNIFQQSAAFN